MEALKVFRTIIAATVKEGATMTCKECVHYEICKTLRPIEWCMDKTCSRYTSKAYFIEVVRCRDCKYATTIKDYDMLQDYIWCCRHGNKVIHINNYCSFAMRRDNNE